MKMVWAQSLKKAPDSPRSKEVQLFQQVTFVAQYETWLVHSFHFIYKVQVSPNFLFRDLRNSELSTKNRKYVKNPEVGPI